MLDRVSAKLDDVPARLDLAPAILDRVPPKSAKAKGTVGIGSNLQTAFQAVQGLDAIVRNKYRNDPVTLAEWAAARHVERTPRHTKPAPAPQTKPNP